MTTWLIDPSGDVWPPDSETLRANLGMAHRDIADRVSFLVTNLGFIAVRKLNSGLYVRWRPTYTHRATVAAAILLLREHRQQRVVVCSIGRVVSHALFQSTPQGCDAILSRFATEQCETGGHFVALPRTRASLEPSSALRRIVDELIASELSVEPIALWNTLQRSVGGRFLMLKPDGDHHKLRVSSVGSGYTTISQKWTNEAQGRDFEAQPDRAYAKAASRGFWSATEQGSPVVEDVEASLWIPSRGRIAIRYTRLIVPLKIDGRMHILGTSELHESRPSVPEQEHA